MGLINDLMAAMVGSQGKLIAFSGRQRVDITYDKLYLRVCNAARWLKNKGLRQGDVLGIIGKNELEWIIADLACIYSGIKLLPLEMHTDPGQLNGGRLQLTALLVSREYAGTVAFNVTLPLMLLAELAAAPDTGNEGDAPYTYNPDEVLSYKFTSGSSGVAKIIGHAVQSAENSIQAVQALFQHNSQDRMLLFLPLNLLQQRYWIYSSILFGFTVIVVPKEYVFVAFKQERPTVFMGVPYIFEVIYHQFRIREENNNTVQQELKAFLGGHIRYLWTGSAPISKDIVTFYFNMGVPLYQGYGMNETCIIAKNHPARNKTGSVGPVFPGVRLRFDDQGQILVKSDFPVCDSYALAPPGEDLRTFRKDGYVATGDIGFLDEEGYLFITGRIKDLIVLSNSKKIFPRQIEETLEEDTAIHRCILYGDNKPYLVAMIIPSRKSIGHSEIADAVEKFNRKSKEEERIYKFHISYDGITEEDKMLSNQHKIRRKALYEKFHSEFELLYNNEP
jgi:long-subunit acyl-CoA synthetase (AMP-forming)